MNKNTDSSMVLLPGGTFQMGDKENKGFKLDREGPQVAVEAQPFLINATTVTNADFQSFVQETGYITDAEKFGWSFVFHLLLPAGDREEYPVAPHANWWRVVEGATWENPEGPNSSIDYRMDHPVTHVSRNDALAYCKWSGKRLPTEVEWEFAARGGLENKLYPWGNELVPSGEHRCNIWQGVFPTRNTEEDGYLGTAPAHTYKPNGYGLYQMAGNVWEWCLNPARIPLQELQTSSPQEFFKSHDHESAGEYALKGGSFLCHDSYCNRYRVAARNGNTADTSASNIGFRCVKDVRLSKNIS